jgi:hypothetical protein
VLLAALAVLAAGGAMLRMRRRGEIWHTLRDRG